jgi:hypothetical protein
MDNNVAERDQRTPVVARKNFYGSGSPWSGALAAMMFSLLMTMRLWGINPRTWLTAYLEACAANGGQPPACLSAFLPWTMECRPVWHRCVASRSIRPTPSTAREALLRAPLHPGRTADHPPPDRGQSPRQPCAALAPGVRAVRLAQAEWRAEGHDLPGGHAAHASRRLFITLPAARHAPLANPSISPPPPPIPNRCSPSRCMNCRRSTCARSPVRPTPGCGTSTSPATTIWATRPWPAVRAATSSSPASVLVALLSFGASAWKLAARERFIGWQEDERQRNLQLVVNNARFLILPWIQSKGLASKILSLIHRQLPNDWLARYGYRPVLLETFVETPRHRGTCYQAANWIKVGQTAPGVARSVPPASHPAHQGHLALSAAQELPLNLVSLAPLANARPGPRVHRILTAELAKLVLRKLRAGGVISASGNSAASVLCRHSRGAMKSGNGSRPWESMD